jgi:chorismate synthase
MTNENQAVEVEQKDVQTEEVAKPKRTRKVIVKVQKTAQQVVSELETLKSEHDELGTALQELSADSVAYGIVEVAYKAKQEELDKALNVVYTI